MSIRYYLFLLIGGASLVPLVFFGMWPQSLALENLKADVSERHLLLAETLGEALERYDRDARAVLRFLSHQAVDHHLDLEADILLSNLSFQHICVLDRGAGVIVRTIGGSVHPCPDAVPPEQFRFFQQHAVEGSIRYTPVVPGASGEPILYLLYPLGNRLVFGALRTDYFVELGKSVAFGEKGHAAIVDSAGNLLAHPAPEWVAGMENISALEPVQRMMAGEAGVTTFFSPVLNDEMIAGFTSVPTPGWGVMIPQPLAELEARAEEERLYAFTIIVCGVLIAAILSWFLSGLLSRRISKVAKAARSIAAGRRGVAVAAPGGLTPLEFRELSQAFNSMAQAVDETKRRQDVLLETAEGASEAKSHFLAHMSHEFRTPLNAILGFTQMISDKVFGPLGNDRYEEYVSLIRLSGNHMLELVDDILDIAKIEAGQYQLTESEFDLNDVLDTCLRLSKGRPDAADLTCEFRPHAKGLVIRADKCVIRQIVINLLTNAIKFNRPGGRVELVTNQNGNGLEIVVSDTGIGIEPENIPQVLEPFGQERINAVMAHEGTGLGLSLCKRLVELHDGTLRIVSQPGEGTNVIVLLPIDRVVRPQDVPVTEAD